MQIGHIALVSSSEEKANRFYKDGLGLKELRSMVIPAGLSRSIFGIDQELKVIDFGDERIKFEVFILKSEGVFPLKKTRLYLPRSRGPGGPADKMEGIGLRSPSGSERRFPCCIS